MYVPKMNHAQRRERRKLIASQVLAAGGTRASLDEACQVHGVSIHTVRTACATEGVTFQKSRRGHPPLQGRTLAILARLLKGDLNQTEIAAELGLSRQRVSAVKIEAEREGIAFPERSDE